MGRVLEILKTNNKKADDQRKQKPYLLRYKKPEFEVVDHYRHLCQLNRIYWMLEQKLQQANYGEFNDAFPELLNQYTKIGHDISFLDNKRNAQVKKQYQYGEATVAYVMYLRSLDMNKPKDVKILFAHFLVRILSDLFDDQEMKANLNRLYQKQNVLDRHSEKGVMFYTVPNGELEKLSKWLDENLSPEVLDKTFLDASISAIKYHENILHELEKTRVSPMMRKMCTFFGDADNQRKIGMAAGMVVAAAVGTAVVLTKVM